MSENTWTPQSGLAPTQHGLELGHQSPKPTSAGPVQPNELPHAASLLRKAIGIGKEYEGALRVNAKALRAIAAAQIKWPAQHTEQWLVEAKALTKHVDCLKSQPDTSQKLRRDGGIPQIQSWDAIHVDHLPHEKASQLEALLGRAVLQSAARQEVVSVHILEAARLLVKSRSHVNSPLHDLLMTVNLCEPAELAAYDAACQRSAYVRNILSALQRVAADPILPPPEFHPKPVPTSIANLSADPFTVQHEDGATADKSDQQPKEPRSPSIGARLHTASLAPYQTALGLTHRDFIPPDDFGKAISQLAKTFEESEGATLCLLSCLMCTEDAQLLQVPLTRQGDIWIEPDCASWGWNFAQYRNSGARTDTPPAVEPILIDLPPTLAQRLNALRRQNPNAALVGDLFLQEEESLLKQARKAANELSPATEHAIYRGRLAKSWALYLLHHTRSDMAVAMLTAQFWFTAPAALFYYNPLKRELRERLARSYQSIGLGTLTLATDDETDRVNTTSIVETSALKAAIQLLLERAKDSTSSTGEVPIEIANRTMTSLASIFVLLTGHRASKPEMLTYGALAAHPSLMLIDDKVIEDETHRNHPRVLPKTAMVNWVLQTANALRTRMGAAPPTRSDPAFLQWTTPDEPPAAITTASIAECIRNLLGMQHRANCARSWWVTELDRRDADRWLTRTLTGHAREVTRVGGVYVSTPVVEATSKLALLMEHIHRDCFAVYMSDAPFSIEIRSEARPRTPKTVSNKEEPSALLPPIDERTLIDAANFQFVRKALLARPPTHARNAAAFMSAVFLDGVPDLTACIDIALAKPTQKFGSTACASRQREHFVHAYQFPAPIAELWVRNSKEASPAELVAQLQQAIRALNLPLVAKGASMLQAVFDLGVAHRRLQLSPWLTAISLEHYPSSTLSERSLHSLTGTLSEQAKPIAKPSSARLPLRKLKDSSLEFLSKSLLECSDTTVRLGEEIRRAQRALEKIETDHSQAFTPKTRALKDWVVEELKGSIFRRSGKYALSTLYTYFQALARAMRQVDACECIEDWDTESWDAFLAAGSGDQNFRDACAALLRSLKRRGIAIPANVLLSQGESPLNAPRNSSASSLVTESSLHDLKALIQEQYGQVPLAHARQMMRYEISIANPVRGSEPGSLTQDSILGSNALTIRRQGYSVHKSDGAVRLQFLPPESFARIKSLAAEIRHLNANGRFLLKGHGTPEEGAIDEEEQDAFNQLIKIATSNPDARTHSLRAASLQNLLTPGWQSMAARLLMGKLDCSSTSLWMRSLDEADLEWLAVGKAIAAAGHADLRSALGYYLANWPLLIAIAAWASLTECRPSHQFLLGIGLKPNTLRATRCRFRAQEGEANFCDWRWIRQVTRLIPKFDDQESSTPFKRAHPTSDELGDVTQQVMPVFSAQVVRYLVLRGLGRDKDLAITEASLRRVDANFYDHLSLRLEHCSDALRRGRGETGARAVSATIQMVVSDANDGYFSAALSLTKPEVHAICGLLDRNQTQATSTHIHGIRALKRVLPSHIRLIVHIGSKYVDALNPLLADRGISIHPTPKLGATPAVGLRLTPANLVLGARLLGFIRLVFAQLSLIHDHV